MSCKPSRLCSGSLHENLCRYKKVWTFCQACSSPRSCGSWLILKRGNTEACWTQLCSVLIHLVTNSKCAAVLNQKKLHLLLKDQYVVSAGLPEGMFSDRLFTFGNYSASTALNCCSLSDRKRETLNRSSTSFSESVQKDPCTFKSVSIKHHVPCFLGLSEETKKS